MTGLPPRSPRKEMIGNSIAERVEELACLSRPTTATSGGGLMLADSSTSGQNASMPRSCEPACKKDPHFGVIGIQSGPRNSQPGLGGLHTRPDCG